MYIELLDSTTTTDHVLKRIRQKWGANHVLVTSDRLQLEDTAATRDITSYVVQYRICCCVAGIGFWKAPAESCMQLLIKTLLNNATF